MQLTAGVAATTLLRPEICGPAHAQGVAASAAGSGSRVLSESRYNILFVFTDQERYFDRWPKGLSLPGHERLQRTGLAFQSHYCRR